MNVTDAHFAMAEVTAPTSLSLASAVEIARAEDFDETRFEEAWRLSNLADHEEAPVHLVSAVREELVLRLRELFMQQMQAACAIVDQPSRRDAFARAAKLGKTFVTSIEDEWARTLRVFQPFMQAVELEVGGMPTALSDA